MVATVTRREVRRRSLLHRCTYVLLEHSAGHVLVLRRTLTQDVYPGAYDVFSGGVCAAGGESYDECARREVAEEVGVDGAELAFRFSTAIADRPVRPGAPCMRGAGTASSTHRTLRSSGSCGSRRVSSIACSAS